MVLNFVVYNVTVFTCCVYSYMGALYLDAVGFKWKGKALNEKDKHKVPPFCESAEQRW